MNTTAVWSDTAPPQPPSQYRVTIETDEDHLKRLFLSCEGTITMLESGPLGEVQVINGRNGPVNLPPKRRVVFLASYPTGKDAWLFCNFAAGLGGTVEELTSA